MEVPLAATHHLRNSINTGKAIPREILERYEIPIVASALKLYLLELPDSLVSSQVYEIMKTIYSTPDSSTSSEARISVLQNTLGQLRLANIATLDAISTHFTRLIELTTADEAFVSSLAQILAPCILRPRTDTSLTMHERHSYRLIRDLFAHKEAIFGELKRASTLSHTPSGGSSSAPRLRAISTDESNRRANMEARNRAIASKSPRATSPAPHANGRNSHRRDRSSGPAETRFPIQTSPTGVAEVQRKSLVRQSLEVPGSQDNSPVVEKHNPLSSHTNHRDSIPENPLLQDEPMKSSSNGDTEDISSAPETVNGGFAEKRDSLSRGTRVPPRKGVVARAGLVSDRNSVGGEGSRPVGVQLSDRPMDD